MVTEIGVTPEPEDGHSENLKQLLANQEVAQSRSGAGNLQDYAAIESVSWPLNINPVKRRP